MGRRPRGALREDEKTVEGIVLSDFDDESPSSLEDLSRNAATNRAMDEARDVLRNEESNGTKVMKDTTFAESKDYNPHGLDCAEILPLTYEPKPTELKWKFYNPPKYRTEGELPNWIGNVQYECSACGETSRIKYANAKFLVAKHMQEKHKSSHICALMPSSKGGQPNGYSRIPTDFPTKNVVPVKSAEERRQDAEKKKQRKQQKQHDELHRIWPKGPYTRRQKDGRVGFKDYKEAAMRDYFLKKKDAGREEEGVCLAEVPKEILEKYRELEKQGKFLSVDGDGVGYQQAPVVKEFPQESDSANDGAEYAAATSAEESVKQKTSRNAAAKEDMDENVDTKKENEFTQKETAGQWFLKKDTNGSGKSAKDLPFANVAKYNPHGLDCVTILPVTYQPKPDELKWDYFVPSQHANRGKLPKYIGNVQYECSICKVRCAYSGAKCEIARHMKYHHTSTHICALMPCSKDHEHFGYVRIPTHFPNKNPIPPKSIEQQYENEQKKVEKERARIPDNEETVAGPRGRLREDEKTAKDIVFSELDDESPSSLEELSVKAATNKAMDEARDAMRNKESHGSGKIYKDLQFANASEYNPHGLDCETILPVNYQPKPDELTWNFFIPSKHANRGKLPKWIGNVQYECSICKVKLAYSTAKYEIAHHMKMRHMTTHKCALMPTSKNHEHFGYVRIPTHFPNKNPIPPKSREQQYENEQKKVEKERARIPDNEETAAGPRGTLREDEKTVNDIVFAEFDDESPSSLEELSVRAATNKARDEARDAMRNKESNGSGKIIYKDLRFATDPKYNPHGLDCITILPATYQPKPDELTWNFFIPSQHGNGGKLPKWIGNVQYECSICKVRCAYSGAKFEIARHMKEHHERTHKCALMPCSRKHEHSGYSRIPTHFPNTPKSSEQQYENEQKKVEKERARIPDNEETVAGPRGRLREDEKTVKHIDFSEFDDESPSLLEDLSRNAATNKAMDEAHDALRNKESNGSGKIYKDLPLANASEYNPHGLDCETLLPVQYQPKPDELKWDYFIPSQHANGGMLPRWIGNVQYECSICKVRCAYSGAKCEIARHMKEHHMSTHKCALMPCSRYHEHCGYVRIPTHFPNKNPIPPKSRDQQCENEPKKVEKERARIPDNEETVEKPRGTLREDENTVKHIDFSEFDDESPSLLEDLSRSAVTNKAMDEARDALRNEESNGSGKIIYKDLRFATDPKYNPHGLDCVTILPATYQPKPDELKWDYFVPSQHANRGKLPKWIGNVQYECSICKVRCAYSGAKFEIARHMKEHHESTHKCALMPCSRKREHCGYSRIPTHFPNTPKSREQQYENEPKKVEKERARIPDNEETVAGPRGTLQEDEKTANDIVFSEFDDESPSSLEELSVKAATNKARDETCNEPPSTLVTKRSAEAYDMTSIKRQKNDGSAN